jgi:hypothetical protein
MATIQDCVQLLIEESPRYEGAPTTTPYRLSTNACWLPVQTTGLNPGVQLLDRADELRGIEGAPPQLVETYEVAGGISMRGYINQLTWLLQLSGFTGLLTAGNGIITDPDAQTIPTGASRWEFTKRVGITAKTAQMILAYANFGVFLRGQGIGVSGWTLNADGAYTADLMGLVEGNIADPNLTPSLDAMSIVPIRRGDLFLTWLASSGTTDDFTISATNPLMRRRTLSLATPSNFPDKMEHGDEKVRVGGSIPKSALADADVDALLAASTFAAKARWKTPVNIGATGYKYSIWVDMPKCQIIGGTVDEIANRRRFGGSYDWQAAWDDVAGYDVKITLVNGVPAIETYS